MKLGAALKGGSGFEAKHPRVPAGQGDRSGEFTSSSGSWAAGQKAKEAKRKHDERVARAKATTPRTAKKEQDVAAEVERLVAGLFGLKPAGRDKRGHHKALDVVLPKGKVDQRHHRVEVKAMTHATKNSRAMVKRDQKARKVAEAAPTRSVLHTITIDARVSKPWPMYYHVGVGAWRVHSRTTGLLLQPQFFNLRELKALMRKAK